MEIVVKIILTIICLIAGSFGPTLILEAYGLSFGLMTMSCALVIAICTLVWRCPSKYIVTGFKDPSWGNNKKDVYGLRSELFRHINTKNFLSPYDYEKILCSNNLIKQLDRIDAYDIVRLKEIRKTAEYNLSIKLNAEAFYNHLMAVFSPIKFLKNENLFNQMNMLCQTLSEINHKDIDIIENTLNYINDNIINPQKEHRSLHIKLIITLFGCLIIMDLITTISVG